MIRWAAIHFVIALSWMFLSGNTTLGGLIAGLIGGFIMMRVFQNPLGCRDYIRRVVAAVVFLGRFLLMIVISNLRIARAALRRDAASLQGEFITYPIGDLNHFETLIICQCIGLTPGTIVAEQSEDGTVLILHAFASGTPEEIRHSLDQELKRGILAFTR
jgi:multisubunit Na+/H+ antiporter MnhE subunit